MISELLSLLMETTLASSAALVVVLLLRRPMRRVFGASAAYALWALVPVALVAVLLPAPVRPLALAPVAATVATLQPVQIAPAQASLAWWLLPVAWGIGMMVMMVMMALQLWQQRRFLRRLGPLRVHAHGVRVASTSAGLPAVTGVLRPRIVLPADFLARYDAHERDLVVAHERQHITRGDLPCNALVALLRSVYWFNPLLHWAVARYRHDQELACDARVLARHPRARRTYAQAMLKTQLDTFALPVGCHWHTHPIKERIAMLKRPSPRRWQTGVSNVLLAALLSGGGYAAWAQQPAVKQTAVSGKAAVDPIKADKVAPAAGKQVGRPDNASASVDAGPVSSQASAVPAVLQEAQPPYDANRPPPRYPVSAAQNGITGRVIVIAAFAADGHVTDAYVERSNPAGVFDEASLEAVRKWKFKPALEHGKPVAGRMRVPIDFDLDPPGPAQVPGANSSAADYGRSTPKPGQTQLKDVFCDASAGRTDKGAEGEACDLKKSGASSAPAGKQILGNVAADGMVSNVRLDTDRTPSALEQAAMEALRKSPMTPAMKQGQPVAGTFAMDMTKSIPVPPGGAR